MTLGLKAPLFLIMKVAIVTAVWKRHEVFEIFAQKIKALHSEGVQIKVFAVGSEGEVSKQMVEKHGFNYSEHPNDFISDKFNLAVRQAGLWNPNYILIAGSDDIMCNDMFNLYVGLMKRKVDFIAVKDFYIYDSVTRKAMYWGGYNCQRSGEPAGAFRCISRKLMRKLNWQPYDFNLKKGIDRTLWNKLSGISHSRCIFSVKKEGVMPVDIKSETNINYFHLWNNCHSISSKDIIEKFNL